MFGITAKSQIFNYIFSKVAKIYVSFRKLKRSKRNTDYILWEIGIAVLTISEYIIRSVLIIFVYSKEEVNE